jgi:hypothetical protein
MEAPRALAPLIDPNVHSCGTVPPHGVEELAQPEAGFYVVGMKSYGRAPTFLMLTGYEQVRSIACALTGDLAGARRVELTLPATGVCSAPPVGAHASHAVTPDTAVSCCGGPAPATVDACCAHDAEAKAVGQDGCGCGSEGRAAAAVTPDTAATTHGPPPITRFVPLGTLRGSQSASRCCG